MDYKISEGNAIGYLPTEFGPTGNALTEKKLIAASDISKGQVVILTDSLTVAPSSAASKYVLGVAMFDYKAGDPVAVETEGLFKLKASAVAITAPVQVESALDGTVAAAGGTPVKVIGLALNDAGSGEYVYVKFSI